MGGQLYVIVFITFVIITIAVLAKQYVLQVWWMFVDVS